MYDLQTAFQLPQGKASLFYYKSKLNVHNFTVADISKKDTSKEKIIAICGMKALQTEVVWKLQAVFMNS